MGETKGADLASNVEWKEWGKIDPLWGVASWPDRQRGGPRPWTDDEFYALGADWHDFEEAWRRCGGRSDGTVLEIGCGAGRMTRMLSGSFVHVIAADVSTDMIAYARARVLHENIDWQVSDGVKLPAADASVDAVFSCHVFQHFLDNRAQLATFAQIHRILKPGGSFFVHIPIHSFPESNDKYVHMARASYAAYLRLARVTMALRRLLMTFGGKPYMRGVSYEMLPLINDLKNLGFLDISIAMVTVSSDDRLHSCVYGRKV